MEITEKNVKMIIAIRRDLKMTRGKEIAQSCHACLGAILRNNEYKYDSEKQELNHIHMDKDVFNWLEGDFTKVCVKVDSEEELLALKHKADELAINNCLVYDAGKTMFHGVETATCIALGPAPAAMLEPITGNLKLY